MFIHTLRVVHNKTIRFYDDYNVRRPFSDEPWSFSRRFVVVNSQISSRNGFIRHITYIRTFQPIGKQLRTRMERGECKRENKLSAVRDSDTWRYGIVSYICDVRISTIGGGGS